MSTEDDNKDTYTLPGELVRRISKILQDHWFISNDGEDFNDEPVIAASEELDAEIDRQDKA